MTSKPDSGKLKTTSPHRTTRSKKKSTAHQIFPSMRHKRSRRKYIPRAALKASSHEIALSSRSSFFLPLSRARARIPAPTRLYRGPRRASFYCPRRARASLSKTRNSSAADTYTFSRVVASFSRKGSKPGDVSAGEISV